jgi:hypothetical protein
MAQTDHKYWPSARHFNEAIQCPGVSFADHLLRVTQPAVDRLGMPLVTSGQFAYVYKLKSTNGAGDFAVRCFRGYLGDRDQRYRAIQQHIRSFPPLAYSGFTYEPEGILVGGTRFPIIFMKWIEGPTLDSYVEEMLVRREVLLHLAAEWLKLVGALREAHIAHGDLQHGNIIIERGNLRLVDHDGIFVPAMTDWIASELGHQHYQHPRRDSQLFDSNLDNFSALVIYLSLLSLAEEPGLWIEHHDENLLFTKTDFLDPATSNLFSKIKRLGPELQRLAEILDHAATGEPAAVPCLLDLVSVKSALPAWMSAPLDIEIKTKTREVIGQSPVLKQNPRWQPWQARQAGSSVPATTPSQTFQTIFSGPASSTPAAIAGLKDPSRIWRNTPVFARELLTKNFLWWYWGFYFCLKFVGLDFFYSIFVALSCMAAIALTYGFIQARQLAQAAVLQTNLLPSITTTVAKAAAASSVSGITIHQLHPASITSSDPIIANRVLSIYHAADCPWVDQISPRNRMSFLSTADALAAGYKPCQACSP